MLSISNLFVLEESFFEDTKKTLSKYFDIKQVRQFIDLSKKIVKDGADSLSEKERQIYRGLFDDPAVKDYIVAARRAGERDGWIRGGVIGGLTGGTVGSIVGGEWQFHVILELLEQLFLLLFLGYLVLLQVVLL